MLSSPSKNLQARQRATHRRQNSTPSAFEASKVPALPHVQQQRQRALGHRRGLSLDTRRQPMSPGTTTTTTKTSQTPTRQGFAQVSNNTNTGLATNHPQHVLREAQQQRIEAHPGLEHHHRHLRQKSQQQQRQFQYQHQQQNFMSAVNDNESYLMSPHGTPQHQRFDSVSFDGTAVPFDPFTGGMNGMVPMSKEQVGYAGAMVTDKDFELFGNDSGLSTPAFLNFADSPGPAASWQSEGDASNASSRRSSRRISNGIMDRVAKFENMGTMESDQRPATPPAQEDGSNYFPPTPMETPHDRVSKQEPSTRPNRFSEGYDESMEETLKPVRSKPNARTQSIFQEMRKRAEESDSVQTPPQSSTIPEAKMFENQVPTADFMNMNNFNNEFMKIESHDGFDGMSDMSQHSTPQTPHTGVQPRRPFDNLPDLHHPAMTSSPLTPNRGEGSHRRSPHRRTESVASIASAASIASINIEETKQETGVTLEDISHYIQGPDASDNKWVCVFEDCGKRFGRKENIKSHVQTHLNDRQYQCPSCSKCFVRQHDLKRHAKIHTGIKPYPCECGNSFARHDALTRHRQRGMCIGAFDGIVKKVVKRGRPRKHRPEVDERVNKSARTRQKNQSISSVSSQSGYSDTSGANSPIENFSYQNEQDGTTGYNGYPSPVPRDMNGGSEPMATHAPMPHQPASISSAPMPSLSAPAPAPHQPEMTASPSIASSQHSISVTNSPYVSPDEIMEMPQPLFPIQNSTTSSPNKTESVTSQYNTPPELSQSSSPPPSTHQYFDAGEPNSSGTYSGGAEDSLFEGMRNNTGSANTSGVVLGNGGLHIGNTSLSGLGFGGVDQDEELLMKAFTNDDALAGFDRNFMTKFDEFDDTVDMFTNADDVFFGTS